MEKQDGAENLSWLYKRSTLQKLYRNFASVIAMYAILYLLPIITDTEKHAYQVRFVQRSVTKRQPYIVKYSIELSCTQIRICKTILKMTVN